VWRKKRTNVLFCDGLSTGQWAHYLEIRLAKANWPYISALGQLGQILIMGTEGFIDAPAGNTAIRWLSGCP
jgi:hypothetical protein